jgi:hypothetical protein
MAIDCGGYRRTWADVGSGHLVKWPASMAAHQVGIADENSMGELWW